MENITASVGHLMKDHELVYDYLIIKEMSEQAGFILGIDEEGFEVRTLLGQHRTFETVEQLSAFMDGWIMAKANYKIP